MKKCKICGQEINLTISGMPEDVCWECLQKKDDVISENIEKLSKDLYGLETNTFTKTFKIPVGKLSPEEAMKSLKKLVKKFKKNNLADVLILTHEESQSNINWFKSKRDDALEQLNNSVNSGDSEEIIFGKFHRLIEFQKHLRMLEDAQIVYCLTKRKTNES